MSDSEKCCGEKLTKGRERGSRVVCVRDGHRHITEKLTFEQSLEGDEGVGLADNIGEEKGDGVQ